MKLFACNRRVQVTSRREFLARSSFGFGSLALGYLIHGESAMASESSSGEVSSLALKAPHFAAKAKSVFMACTAAQQNNGPPQSS